MTDFGGLYSPADLERRHRGHFFDPDTMRSFGSRVLGDIFPARGGGRSYFVTSERDRLGGAWGGERRYTVRVMSWLTGDVNEPYTDGLMGSFGAYPTPGRAVRAARELASADLVGFAGLPCPIGTHRRYTQPVTYRRRTYCGGCLDDVQRHARSRATVGEAVAAMKAGAL